MSANSWIQEGKIYCWRYTAGSKSARGWHLTADHIGAESLLCLLKLFKQSETLSYRTAQLSPVDQEILKIPNLGRSIESFSKLKIHYNHNCIESSTWNISSSHQKITLELTKNNISNFLRGVQLLSDGFGDYSLTSCVDNSRNSPTFSFWWHPTFDSGQRITNSECEEKYFTHRHTLKT